MTLRGLILALALVSLFMFPSRGQPPPLPQSIDPPKASSHTNWLGWDDFRNPSGTRYRLLIGWSSGLYTMTNDAGTNKTIRVIWPTATTSYYNVVAYSTNNEVSDTNGEVRLPQVPRTDTNTLLTIRGTNLIWGLTLAGSWQTTGLGVIVLTNPAGTKFFRGNGRVTISRTNF